MVSVVVHFTVHRDDITGPSALGVLLIAGSTLPLTWRRSRPVTIAFVCVLSQASLEALNMIGPGWLGVMLAAYSVGAYSSGRRVLIGGGLLWTGVLAFMILGVTRGEAPWQTVVPNGVLFAAVIELGEIMRRRREQALELRERLERAERERDLLAAQHVQLERSRIARELHDVVAHSVNVMIIQAAAAKRQLNHSPQLAAEAMTTIESTGRQAMVEMRHILGVLRSADSAADRAPQPTFDMLPELCSTDPTMHVVYSASGQLAPASPGVELNAYRVVQEALTNVRRHAGRVSSVEVRLVGGDGMVQIEVLDDGRGSAADITDGGFGLLGMTERVHAYGGELKAGPRPGGGWRVAATMPLVPR